MVSWCCYDDLDLDEIFQITDADNARAPELDEQAVAVRELLGRVKVNLDKVDLARKRLGLAFQGLSAVAAAEDTGALGDKTAEAEGRLGRHESVLAGVASLARETHAQMIDLRGQRDAEIERLRQDPADPRLLAEYGEWGDEGDPKAIEAAIRERFDAAARSIMVSSAESYLAQIGSLKPVESYEGLRHGAPVGEDGIAWDGRDSAGPSMTRTASATAPGSAGGPELQASVLAPGTVAPPPVNTGYLAPPGGYYVAPGAVSAPVFGGGSVRPPTVAARTPLPRPNTSGVIAPNLGERPGKAFDSLGRQQPQSVVRPGPELRPAPLPGQVVGRPGRGFETGDSRTPPARRTGAGSVRALPPAEPRPPGTRAAGAGGHRAEGRVIRAGGAVSRTERGSFVQAPRAVHGGSDAPNRPVVRNSRVPSTQEPGREPERRRADEEPPRWDADGPAESELWPDEPTTVVPPVIRSGPTEHDGFGHDPGPFLTPRNLGRRNTGS